MVAPGVPPFGSRTFYSTRTHPLARLATRDLAREKQKTPLRALNKLVVDYYEREKMWGEDTERTL